MNCQNFQSFNNVTLEKLSSELNNFQHSFGKDPWNEYNRGERPDRSQTRPAQILVVSDFLPRPSVIQP